MLDDDLWGSDNEGDRRAASELDQEWQARQNQFHTLGYRDGVEAGKNASVQEGFNVGYAEATVAGFNFGLARGLTVAFAALPGPTRENLVGGEARARLEALEVSIRSYSSTDTQRAFYQNDVRAQDVASSMAGLNRLPETQSVGVWEAAGEAGSAVTAIATGEQLPADGRSELEELERSVRSELEAASVKICDVLVAV